MQRHYLRPRQLLSASCFGPLFERLGRDSVGFDDFRRNGLLLPSTDRAALRIGLPLHCGLHRHYNATVFERVGQIKDRCTERRLNAAGDALEEALFRLGVLQQGLRRRLLAERRRLLLNRADPLGAGRDFAALNTMAELLRRETEMADSGHGFQPLIRNSS